MKSICFLMYDVLGGKHTYDKKFDSDVYQFRNCTVEVYNDDHQAYTSGNYLRDVRIIDGLEYGDKDLFDIMDAAMIIDAENRIVIFLTRNYIEKILVTETDELEKTAPDLVRDINDLLCSGVEMRFNVNTIFTSVATDQAVSATNPYERTFVCLW